MLRNNNTEWSEELLRNNGGDSKSFGEDLAVDLCDEPSRKAISHAHTCRQGWNLRKCTTKTRFWENHCDNLCWTNNMEYERLLKKFSKSGFIKIDQILMEKCVIYIDDVDNVPEQRETQPVTTETSFWVCWKEGDRFYRPTKFQKKLFTH